MSTPKVIAKVEPPKPEPSNVIPKGEPPKPLIKETVTEEKLEPEALPTTENDIYYPPNYIPQIS